MSRSWLALVVAGLGGWVAASPGVQDRPTAVRQGDAEEEEYRRVMGHGVMENACLVCHGVELIETQRLSEEQWVAELDKMVGWGALVREEQRPVLVEYLVATYGAGVPGSPVVTVGGAEIAKVAPGGLGEARRAVMADVKSGAALYRVHCASCHGERGGGGDLGTNLRERPILADEAAFREVVEAGRRTMPEYRAVVGRSGVEDLRAWLLSLDEAGS